MAYNHNVHCTLQTLTFVMQVVINPNTCCRWSRGDSGQKNREVKRVYIPIFNTQLCILTIFSLFLSFIIMLSGNHAIPINLSVPINYSAGLLFSSLLARNWNQSFGDNFLLSFKLSSVHIHYIVHTHVHIMSLWYLSERVSEVSNAMQKILNLIRLTI
jgi:hypothetical protein